MLPDTAAEWLWSFFTLIIGAIVLPMIYDYSVKPKMDSFRGRYSEKQKLKNETRKKEIDEIVERMLCSPPEMIRFHFIHLQRVIASTSMIILVLLTGIMLMLVTYDLSRKMGNIKPAGLFYPHLFQSPELRSYGILQILFIGIMLFGTFTVMQMTAKIRRDNQIMEAEGAKIKATKEKGDTNHA